MEIVEYRVAKENGLCGLFCGLKTILIRIVSMYKIKKTYGTCFKFLCNPEENAQSVLNYLTIGYPSPNINLHGTEIEFIEGPNKGKRYVFFVDMSEI